MSRTQQSRTLAVFAATAVAAALPLFSAGTAVATPAGDDCRSATIQYRIVDADGGVVGSDWTSQGGFHLWDTVPGNVEVRLAPDQTVGAGCTYPVSLAEYTTEGANWYVSGHQTLVDKATVYLTAADIAAKADTKRNWQRLSVKSPSCYGQIDLYGDDVTYDGKTGEGHGPAPYEPDNIVTPYNLIAAWNGGDKPCTPDTHGSPTPSSPAPSAPGTPTPPADSTPPASETTPPATPSPSTTPPTTSHVPPMSSPPPTTPEPTPSRSTPPLAETGASDSTGLIAGGAVLVIALGAGAVYAAGRRTRRS
ncbi:LAETG motif-containing sortase-dependent surface protein [Streptomyces sp. NPDC048291]|uniref:LAETG motif-containing sortase-dependent surface protein n=1 Tax=Streptomyces sp. NPDC048291 TaxID=3365530 RepID=UPI0037182ED9